MDHQVTVRSNNSLLSNTKKAIAYEPRTEAISPAINDDIIAAEDSTSKSTKDEQTLLVEKLKKVEAEILQTDVQISRLRKQKAQLEQAASCNSNDDDDQENVCDTKQLSIAKLVYHENRAKAQKAHSKLDCFGSANRDLPIYNQPSDTAVYHNNAAKFKSSFKNSLIACFRVRFQNRLKLEETVSVEYDRRMEKWLKSIEQDDSQPTKRVKDAKTREFFEKQFPELKKARESGERFSRVGQRVARSDAEFDELLDGITEREDQDKKVKSYAVIPPMLEEMRSRKPKFINTNGYVEDIIAEYKEYQILNTWTDEEKEIFRENYLQNPKNFGLIATLTSRKNVANCVQYYYLSKKSENYKQLLKRQQKRRTRSFVRPAPQTPAIVTNETSNSSTTETNKANGFNSNGDGTNTGGDVAGQTTSADASKSTTSQDTKNEQHPTVHKDDSRTGHPNRTGSMCCICDCETNEYRNVTRSNHQLYGIGLDALKPDMKICYSCRFRHVKQPSFDQPSISPEIYEDEENQMELDPPEYQDQPAASVQSQNQPHPVIDMTNDVLGNKTSNIPSRPLSPSRDMTVHPQVHMSQNNNCEANNKATQKKTSVRDIIFQTIEMSFQQPKAADAIDTQPQAEPIQTDYVQHLNPIPTPTQHAITNVLPTPKSAVANHLLQQQVPQLPTHLPIQNLGVDHQHQLQQAHQLQQKQHQQQQQLQMEFNMRQQHFLSQQMQHQQHQQQQQQLQAQIQHQQKQQQQLQMEFNLRQQQFLSHQIHQQQHFQAHQPPPQAQPPPQSVAAQQHQTIQHIAQSLPQLYPHQSTPPHQILSQMNRHQPVLVPLPPPPKEQIEMTPQGLPLVTQVYPGGPRPIAAPGKPRPPPMAHAAKIMTPAQVASSVTSSMASQVKSEANFDSGVLDLSAPNPQPPPPVASIAQNIVIPETVVSMAVESRSKQEPNRSPPSPPQPSTPAAVPMQVPLPTPAKSPGRDDNSRSPNLTGSPTSPSEMVIDESVDIRSSANSSDQDEATK